MEHAMPQANKQNITPPVKITNIEPHYIEGTLTWFIGEARSARRNYWFMATSTGQIRRVHVERKSPLPGQRFFRTDLYRVNKPRGLAAAVRREAAAKRRKSNH